MTAREPGEPEWPAGVPTTLQSAQVRLAFGGERGGYVGRIVEHDAHGVVVVSVRDGSRHRLLVARRERLAAVLRRDDVTLLEGAPLVLVNEAHRVLGVATGPLEPPKQLRVLSNVCRIEDGEYVEVPASLPGQPSLQVFAIAIAQDERAP